jgi:hypothetical protein
MQLRKEFKRLQRDVTPRDAVITFQCSAPDFVQVNEMIDGDSVQHHEVRRHPDVVTEIEERYIFFAEQAALARRYVMHGHSCAFSVYFREP